MAGWSDGQWSDMPWGGDTSGSQPAAPGDVVDVAQQAALLVKGPVLTASGPAMKKDKK